MLADEIHAHDHVEESAALSGDEDGIEAELSFLLNALANAEGVDEAVSDVELVRDALADAAPRDRYQVIGPTLAKVAVASLATFPAVLTPMASFANEPLPVNMMLAMAQRPEAPPAMAATGSTQLFPFSRPMMDVRSQVKADTAAAPQPSKISLPLNPRLKALFNDTRKVVVTTKAKSAVTFYQVSKGDSLYSIAADLLGSGSRWREIYGANQGKISTTYLLQPGQRLMIPTPRALPAVQMAAASAPSAKGMPANSPSHGAARYKVANGDSLYVIAAKQLGNPLRWKEIVALNKATLQGKTVIYPNQWLLIPSVT
jgi:nucleoid-associated protein YgaU